jgi:sensor histidine kinase YesM
MISVEEEVDRLRNYLDLERLRMKNTFEYTIDFEETDAEDELLIPSMIIQPYVENAVWHGISTCGNEGMIKITFKIHEQNTVRITVEDNGPGIKNVPLQTSKSQQHLNMGTNITRKRLEILGKKHGVKTTIEYEETFPGNPNPGTRVVLVVPLFYSRE